ncbi:MAG: DUF4832 domain-containing protein [Bacteroidales bacterium]|nr:DUF4832 domain-containing protein [Bacteroidales bacterium]
MLSIFSHSRPLAAMAFICLFLCIFCDKPGKGVADPDADFASLTRIDFEVDEKDFANPERGFFCHKEFKASSGTTLISDLTLESQRQLGRTLIYTIYYLNTFMESPISQEYLDYIRGNMEVLRRNGFKCVLRFAYNRSFAQDAHPWDPTWEVISGHIDQLKPIFEECADVIFCLEAGFIGTFGEWYYTDNFNFDPKTVEDYVPRKILFEKLMTAVPASRQIAVRYPAAVMGMLEITAADTLTRKTAHDGSILSRTASHNDCFVSSNDDVGTYHGNAQREFIYANSKYTIWGGETCNLAPVGHCEWSLPYAIKHHMTYLNDDYHKSVLNRWKEDGCYDEIAFRMGYRLHIDRGFVTPEPAKGKELRVALQIHNEGFAAPMNPRKVELVLTGPETKVFTIDADPRFWFEDEESTLDMKVTLPESMASGTYTVSLNLPDPETTLHDDPRYSIRLANKGIWDEETGLNKITTIKL